ncbi:MAG: hypothetical protein ABGZ49_06360 [Akkermansiaceae bacterium]
MKRLFLTALLLALSLGKLSAADAYAVMVYTEKTSGKDDIMKIWITAASPTAIEFKTVAQGLNRTRMMRSTIKSIYFFEPPIFKEATELFESRDYKAAREKLALCKDAFKSVDGLPGNYATLAGFYELECCRKTFDLESLKSLLDAYQFGPLSREFHRNQLEVYQVWDAVRTKSWARLDSLASKLLEEKKWIPEHLAQIKYCHGLALEGLDRKSDALIAFNGAFTADYTASEVITKKAAMSCLRIIKADEEVKLAINLWGTEDEDPNSTGYFLLQEGVALSDLWKKALGGGESLPAEYSFFLNYREANKPKTKKKADPKEAPSTDKKADAAK